MPDEQESQSPTGYTEKDSSNESPIVALPEQSILSNPSEHNSNNVQTETKKKLHWLEVGYFCSQIILAVIGIWALCIYNGQLNVMRGQLTQMQDSSQQTDRLLFLYQQQLAQLTKQASDTHTLAVDSGKQADLARDTLVVANRPWMKISMEISDPLMFWDGGARLGINETLENVGSTVALHVFEWKTIVPLGPNMDDSAAKTLQKRSCDAYRFPKAPLSEDGFFPYDPVSDSSNLRIPEQTIAKGRNARNYIGLVIVGCLSYRSSFEDQTLPYHQTRFEYWIAKPSEVFPQYVDPYVEAMGIHADYKLVKLPKGGMTAD